MAENDMSVEVEFKVKGALIAKLTVENASGGKPCSDYAVLATVPSRVLDGKLASHRFMVHDHRRVEGVFVLIGKVMDQMALRGIV